MKIPHTLFVCTTCASTWKEGKRVGVSGGQKLLEQLSHLHQDWDLQAEFSIKPVECMSACSRPCAISFAAMSKYTYVFGGLATAEETLPTISTAVLNCASLYYAKADGLLPWSERPELLKKGILARIPPLPEAAGNPFLNG
ncbi:MAG: DUF1636 domain-containing protein [Symploca sp. SIO1B1]|nr:DUF1636 domain-containing protein [Symploca sp. SIO1B1]